MQKNTLINLALHQQRVINNQVIELDGIIGYQF
jgi:hypothetical protein